MQYGAIFISIYKILEQFLVNHFIYDVPFLNWTVKK